jgi:hypothetical protein
VAGGLVVEASVGVVAGAGGAGSVRPGWESAPVRVRGVRVVSTWLGRAGSADCVLGVAVVPWKLLGTDVVVPGDEASEVAGCAGVVPTGPRAVVPAWPDAVVLEDGAAVGPPLEPADDMPPGVTEVDGAPTGPTWPGPLGIVPG